MALAVLLKQPWVDPSRIVLAGTSEGAVAVARHSGTGFAARIVYSWSCEPNYFVVEPRNAFEIDKPVLNVISAVDPYFSQANPWLGNPSAKGHCADALKDNKKAAIVLIPGAPHTLLNLPQAREVTAAFMAEWLKP
jgi:dienelactone hydrolase